MPYCRFRAKYFASKLVVDRVSGLAHLGENRVGHMLRGDLQLTGNVVLHQLPEKGVLLVRQQIVEADAAADEHLFDPRAASVACAAMLNVVAEWSAFMFLQGVGNRHCRPRQAPLLSCFSQAG